MWLFMLLIGIGIGIVYRAIRHESPFCRHWPKGRCPFCGKTL